MEPCRFRYLRTPVVLVLPVLSLAACVQTRGGPIPYEAAQLGLPDSPEAPIPSENFTLAPGDKLQIKVYQVEELSSEYTVGLDGNIAMPLIGSVRAVGLTPDELANELARLLDERYLRDPHVSVGVLESPGRTVTVEGSVREPGAFEVREKMTLLEAVARARGLDEFSNPRRVAVFRRIDGQRMAAAFDLVSIRRGEADDPEIFAGDVVVVDGTRTRSILREVLSALPILALFRPY